MDRTLLNRVYVNPNFKGPQTDTWPVESIKTAHFNRNYLEAVPNAATNSKNKTPVLNNRKIFINPNFINGTSIAKTVTSANFGHPKVNETFNCLPNPQPLQKSKYSLVQNIQQKSSQTILRENQYKNVTEIKTDRNTKGSNYVQEAPISRSRYCIIRKKKLLTENYENKNNHLSTDLITNRYPITGSNQFTCYTNVHSLKHSDKTNVPYKVPENVTKIKITKYKTIPINSVKINNIVYNNKKEIVSSLSTKRNVRYSTLNKSRFRLIKTKAHQKISTPLSKAKVTLRVTQKLEKKVSNAIKNPANVSKATFKINNIPCRLYTKYGKCLRQDRGNCKYLHDKKHVSLCRKFLKGICHDAKCTLSHELTVKKMPTCYFYLKGMCTKESCPYLHVKLSDKTKLCQEFSKGYCENGDACAFRHVQIHQLKTPGKIVKNALKRCSQLKDTKAKQFKKDNNVDTINEDVGTEKHIESEEVIKNDNGDCRYYKELVDSDVIYETMKPTRCKLGSLPSFIQL